MSANHVDGEIVIPRFSIPAASTQPFETRVPSVPSDLEYRTVALNAAVQAGGSRAGKDWVISVAQDFEDYLRFGAAG